MDLAQHTLEALDWPALVAAWSQCARTPMGVRAIQSCAPLSDREAVTHAHDAVDEVRWLAEHQAHLHLSGIHDIGTPVYQCSKGEVLDGELLRQIGNSLVALRQVARVLDEHAEEVPVLQTIGTRIHLDFGLVEDLDKAFDASGRLSEQTFPQLATLRKEIDDLHTAVRGTLDRMVKGDSLSDLLQDRFWTQRDNRYVIPIKSHAKRWDLGIVHGTSGSGQTVFVEPKEVVALNNRLRIAEGKLAAEKQRILTGLSRLVGVHADSILFALEAALELDFAVARSVFAERLTATRPTVAEQGVVELAAARHPVLCLRDVEVVPNTLRVSPDVPALVLTGPNTGGKTVALKTLGLCALLVQHGCFVPAAEGSRVDYFHTIAATIGDQQAVHEDLSSFSGQLKNVAAMLDAPAQGRLYLLDELCTGTDPAQGAPLAMAILLALVDAGGRVVTTTHYGLLKSLGTSDPRFRVAAMAYRDGHPTYRLVEGATGESHALATARRLGIRGTVVDRARALMDDTERTLAEALASLDSERHRIAAEAEELEALRVEFEARQRKLSRREQQLAKRSKELEKKGAEAFLSRLKDAEKAVGQVVADLQRDPNHKKAKAARASVQALKALVPKTELAEEAAPAPRSFVEGDAVKLVKLGQRGEVVKVAPGGIQVRVGMLTIKAKPDELELVGGRKPRPAPASVPRTQVTLAPREVELEQAVRLPHNTLDLRGQRVDEAQDASDRFFDRSLMSGNDLVFLLHGHGTGALKDGLRSWLRSNTHVASWAPANAEQGGDAYTVVQLSS